MTFTAFADASKVCVGFDWNGVGVSVCLHFATPTPVEADYIALAAEVADSWSIRLRAQMSDDITMGDVTAYDLSEEGAPKYVNSDSNGDPGTDVSDSIPNNGAVVLSHRSTTTGRSGRGRTYFPGVTEADTTDGLISAAYQTDLAAAWALFISDVFTNTGWRFVVAQRFADGVQLTTGVTRDVTTEVLKRQLGTQRRRQVQSAV